MKLSICIILSLFLSTSLSAKDSPSYDETIEFVLRKLDTTDANSKENFSAKKNRKYVVDKRCEINVTSILIMKSDDDLYHARTNYSLALSEFDPTRIEAKYDGAEGPYVRMRTLESVESIYISINYLPNHEDSSDKNYSYKVSTVDLNTDEPERVVKAMKHLVRLCGGKEELF